MTYFLKKKKWMAWVVLLTFLFTSFMPTNLLAGNSVAEAATTSATGTNTIAVGETLTLTGSSSNYSSSHEWTQMSDNGGSVIFEDGLNSSTVKVKGQSAGTVTITHTYGFMGGRTETYDVTVTDTGEKTIRFDANGGSGTVPASFTAESDEIVTLPSPNNLTAPTGKVFVGWSTNANANETGPDNHASAVYLANDKYVVTQSDTLYAIWGSQNVNARFFIRKDGNIPVEPSGAGVGDYSDHNVSGMKITGAIKVGKFVADTSGARVIANLNAQPNDTALTNALKNIDSKNADFDPKTQKVIWYVMKYVSCGDPYGNEWHVDGIIVDRSKAVVNYDANCNGYSGTVPDGNSYTVPTTVTIENPSGSKWQLQRQGYTFEKWNTKADGSGKDYSPNASLALTEDDADKTITLYAIWRPNRETPYVVEYYYQNDDGTYPSEANDTDNRAGTTNTLAQVTDADEIPNNNTHYFDAENEKNVLSGTIAADGSLVLKVYFKKKTPITIKAGDNSKTYDGIALTQTSYTVKYDGKDYSLGANNNSITLDNGDVVYASTSGSKIDAGWTFNSIVTSGTGAVTIVRMEKTGVQQHRFVKMYSKLKLYM